ncbi:hypothetical protein GCM10010172_72560 [Paractinoplanes ferrugineus]|uniref:Uncharacterized protein n=1 Tax=Paractinoplanes ferrugineus TaxID=113564 RepID=A0A919J323_9ACTN|nr:hypothetical protein Afe05nite_34290 [Actinoplanes ferrugineus]
MRLTLPSTGPELKFKLSPAVTAATSAVRPPAKRLMPGKRSLFGRGDPRGEPFAVQVGHHVGERTHQIDSGTQLRAPVENALKLLGVATDEVVRVSAHPAGHLPDRERAGHSGQIRFAAVLLDESSPGPGTRRRGAGHHP